MKKLVIFGCIIASFLLLIPLNLSAIENDIIHSNVENEVETSGVSVHVYGGIGITISVYSVSDNTVISTFVQGILITRTHSGPVRLNTQQIHIFTCSLFPNDIKLYLTVNDQAFTYEGLAFFVFTHIEPIDA